MKKRKILVLILTLLLLFTSQSMVFAETTTVSGQMGTPSSATATMDLVAEAAMFSVTVPSSMPISVDNLGKVTTGEATIVNNSAAPVEVSSVTITPASGWTLAKMTDDFSMMEAGTKKFAVSVFGNEAGDGGAVDVSGVSSIPAKSEFPFTYSVKMALQKEAGTVTLGNIVVVLSWFGYTPPREPGLYNGDTYTSWDDLVSAGTVHVNNGVVTTNFDLMAGGNSSANTLIGELVIPSTVTSIGTEAFYSCVNLTNVEIPNSVTSIGGSAFGVCNSLTSIIIPEGVVSIGSMAFEQADITKIEIPSSVTTIGGGAFYSTSLTDIYYAGTEDEWNAISGVSNTGMPGNVTIHYNSSMAE